MAYRAVPVYHVRQHDSSAGAKIGVILSVGGLIERRKVITDCQGPLGRQLQKGIAVVAVAWKPVEQGRVKWAIRAERVDIAVSVCGGPGAAAPKSIPGPVR